MRHQFSIEVVTEDYDVLGSLEQRHWTSTAVIPDLSLAEEVESGRVDHLRAAQPVVCSEEDGGSKYAFEGRDQPPVLFSAFLHAEGFQHLGGGRKAIRLALLTHGQGRQKNWNDAVLSEQKAVLGMARNL
jgi:hypothetical protein